MAKPSVTTVFFKKLVHYASTTSALHLDEVSEHLVTSMLLKNSFKQSWLFLKLKK